MSVAGTAVSPRLAVSPGETVCFSVNPLLVDPSSASEDGCAVVRAPGSTNTLRTDSMAALATPRFGSSMYMIRHVIPAAKAEMAIGMKTAVLKATDQLMRSVSTAKTIPNAVTVAGTTSTQKKLFLIDVRIRSLVNISR